MFSFAIQSVYTGTSPEVVFATVGWAGPYILFDRESCMITLSCCDLINAGACAQSVSMRELIYV